MIQFFGLAFSENSVSGTLLGRDLMVTAERSTPIAGIRRDGNGAGDGSAISIPVAEWTRAATYLTHELYLDLAVADRHIWGIGLASPSGWVALDMDYAPLTDVRLMPPSDVAADVVSWLEANRKERNCLQIILSPKDFFRFRISGALAVDATQASAQGMVANDGRNWSDAAVQEAGWKPSWLPPIFDSEVRTGQISPEGAELAGLPRGLWIAAGALHSECARVVAEDHRKGTLWISSSSSRAIYGVDRPPSRVPEGMRVQRAAYSGHWTLEAPLSLGSDAAATDEEAAKALKTGADRIRRVLEDAGYTVNSVADASADADENSSAAAGAAAIAAVSSGMVRDWTDYYKRIERNPS